MVEAACESDKSLLHQKGEQPLNRVRRERLKALAIFSVTQPVGDIIEPPQRQTLLLPNNDCDSPRMHSKHIIDNAMQSHSEILLWKIGI